MAVFYYANPLFPMWTLYLIYAFMVYADFFRKATRAYNKGRVY